ncbi:MAG: M48 family metallopeptidase [Rhodobacteraceae bacterium]|nr:M48 family metallopeptidase [Paracoccaceae bacterium]
MTATARGIVGGLLGCLLAACVTTTAPPEVSSVEVQQEAVIQEQLVRRSSGVAADTQRFSRGHAAASLRANSIHRRLMQANVDSCSRQTTDIGALVANRSGFGFRLNSTDPTYNPSWNRLYPTDEYMRVIEVQAMAPAAWAGLRKGDIITHINSIPLGTDRYANATYRREIQGTDRKSLRIWRNGSEQQIDLYPETICDMPLIILNEDTKNAFADGQHIYLYAGLEDALEDDTQLAIIIGHEMAHNTLGHIDSTIALSALGGLIASAFDPSFKELGQDLGAIAFSQEFESEADYVGVYFAARAGFDVSQAADLWRRMALINPAAIHVPSLTHPSTAKRYNTIRKTSQEIQMKRNLGLPLRYELR